MSNDFVDLCIPRWHPTFRAASTSHSLRAATLGKHRTGDVVTLRSTSTWPRTRCFVLGRGHWMVWALLRDVPHLRKTAATSSAATCCAVVVLSCSLSHHNFHKCINCSPRLNTPVHTLSTVAYPHQPHCEWSVHLATRTAQSAFVLSLVSP